MMRSAVCRESCFGFWVVVSSDGRGRCVMIRGPKWVYAYLWEGLVRVSEARRRRRNCPSVSGSAWDEPSLSGWNFAASLRTLDFISLSVVVEGLTERIV